MRKLISAVALLLALGASAQTWNGWNGKTVGSSSGNLSGMNGKTIGTASGNYVRWNNLSASSGGSMIAAVDSTVTPCTATASSGTSISCTLSSVPANDNIHCNLDWGTDGEIGLSAVSDTANGVYPLVMLIPTPDGNWGFVAAADVVNASAGSRSITATWGQSVYDTTISCFAAKNERSAASVDSAIASYADEATSTANPHVATSSTPSAAGDLILGVLSTGSKTATAGTNYSLTGSISSALFWPETWGQSTATATNCPYTASADTWDMFCVGFLSSSASAGATPMSVGYENFSACSSGSAPTTACLASSTYGVFGAFSYDSSVTNPWSLAGGTTNLTVTSSGGPTNSLVNSFWSNGASYSGSGGLNLQFATGGGGAYVSYAMPAETTMYMTYQFETSIPQTDTSGHQYDEPGMQTTDFSDLTIPTIKATGSALGVWLECSGGSPELSSTSIPISTSTLYTFQITKVTNGGTNSLTVYNSAGVSQGTVTCTGETGSHPAGSVLMGVTGSETEGSGYDIWWRNFRWGTSLPLP